MDALKQLVMTKSFWTGVSMIAVGVGMVLEGTDIQTGIQTIGAGVALIVIRDAIRKGA